jgi:hypothetical protein
MDITYPVVIVCPMSHKEVDTGLTMSEAAFAHPAVEHSAVECPHCGNRHEYDMREAVLKLDADWPDRPSKRSHHPYLRIRRRPARRPHYKRD